MGNLKRVSAVLAAFVLTFSAVGCGKEKSGGSSLSLAESSSSSSSDSKIPSDESVSDNSTSEKSTESSDENSAVATNPAETSASPDTTTKTTETPAKSNAKSSDTNTNNNAPSNNASPQNNDNNNAQSGENSQAANPAQPDAPQPQETVSYTGEVVFGKAVSHSGSNITVSGSTATITAGGDYHICGSISNGQLEVNTPEKVKIYLDGVSITSNSGPAIKISDAKKIVIELVDGTASNITDGGKDKENDGALFSNDTITIKGNGTLNITSHNAHGISSDDDVIIESGTLNISSRKTGIMANDDITINGGSVNVNGGTNGLKSKGTMNISGGTVIAYGGTKEEKSAIYSESEFNFTGGKLYAVGNAVTAPTSMSSPCFVGAFSTSMRANSTINLKKDGSNLITLTPNNNYKCIMVMSSEIGAGSSLGINIDGKDYGTHKLNNDLNGINLT